jgi:hypothetical protein
MIFFTRNGNNSSTGNKFKYELFIEAKSGTGSKFKYELFIEAKLFTIYPAILLCLFYRIERLPQVHILHNIQLATAALWVRIRTLTSLKNTKRAT